MVLFESMAGLSRASSDRSGALNDRQGNIEPSRDRTGRTWCLCFTTRRKLARRCWHGLPSRPALLGRVAMISIVLSRNCPRQAEAKSSKIRSFSQPGPTSPRQNDTSCLMLCIAVQIWNRLLWGVHTRGVFQCSKNSDLLYMWRTVQRCHFTVFRTQPAWLWRILRTATRGYGRRSH